MWARVVEIMIGCWLAMSPFIFRHPTSEPSYWWNDLLCALAVILIASLSFWRPIQWVHLGQLIVAAWLIGFGYFSSSVPHPPETMPAPSLQNDLIVGLFLAMFAIIPNEVSRPPKAWEDKLRERNPQSAA